MCFYSDNLNKEAAAFSYAFLLYLKKMIISLSHVTKAIVFTGIDTYTDGKHEFDF